MEIDAIESAERLLVHARTSAREQAFEAIWSCMLRVGCRRSNDLDLEGQVWCGRPLESRVNDYLQSVSNPSVYAAATRLPAAGFPLTPVAGMQGHRGQQPLKGNHGIPNYAGIPVWSSPRRHWHEVGFTEEVARAEAAFTTNHGDTSDWYTSRRVGLRHTGYKTLVEEGPGGFWAPTCWREHRRGDQSLRSSRSAPGSVRAISAHGICLPTGASDLSSML